MPPVGPLGSSLLGSAIALLGSRLIFILSPVEPTWEKSAVVEPNACDDQGRSEVCERAGAS